jgi:hypothetical protein
MGGAAEVKASVDASARIVKALLSLNFDDGHLTLSKPILAVAPS